jgi:hypothetical protein
MSYKTKVDLSRQSKHFTNTDIEFSGTTNTIQEFSIKGIELDTSGSTSGNTLIFNGTKYIPGNISTGSTLPAYNQIRFVTTTGNDSTALSGRFDLPYQTLHGALSASTSGDLIYVYPGIYTITTTLANNGVNFYLGDGVTVNGNTDSLNMLGSNVTPFNYKICGSGSKNKATINQQHSNGIFMHIADAPGAGSNIYIDGLNITDARAGASRVGTILTWTASNIIYVKNCHITDSANTGWCIRMDNNVDVNTVIIENCYIMGFAHGIHVGSSISVSSNTVNIIRCTIENNNSSSVPESEAFNINMQIEDCRFISGLNTTTNVISINTSPTITFIGTNIIYSKAATYCMVNAVSSTVLPVNIIGNIYTNKPLNAIDGTIIFPMSNITIYSGLTYVSNTL